MTGTHTHTHTHLATGGLEQAELVQHALEFLDVLLELALLLSQLARLVAHAHPQPLHRQVRRQRASHRLLVPLSLHTAARRAKTCQKMFGVSCVAGAPRCLFGGLVERVARTGTLNGFPLPTHAIGQRVLHF